MNIIGILADLLGIGKEALSNRSKLKTLKAEQEFSIIKAETSAITDRIMSNTDSDNSIDAITARNKKYTLKDEILTYLFLTPVVIATVVPFIKAFNTDQWANLNEFVRESYIALDSLPEWYKWILAAIVIDVLGFRSFARKVVEKYIK